MSTRTIKITVADVDSVLPQTQCGLCTYDGCEPYAQAIVHNNDRIDRCPPGGVKVLEILGELTGVDPTPFIPEMKAKAKPTQKVIIREDECIGCTKCIQACPVDAILGAAKSMHTVIADECTGCELCIEPCPVDCIEIVPAEKLDDNSQRTFSDKNRKRYQFRNQRLEIMASEKKSQFRAKKETLDKKVDILAARRAAIHDAVMRSKAKKELQNERSNG